MSTKKGRLGPRRHRDKSKGALVLGHAVVETNPARLDLRVPVQVQADAAAPALPRSQPTKELSICGLRKGIERYRRI